VCRVSHCESEKVKVSAEAQDWLDYGQDRGSITDLAGFSIVYELDDRMAIGVQWMARFNRGRKLKSGDG